MISIVGRFISISFIFEKHSKAMNSKRYYNLLVVLFPLVYLVHNLEEYLVFKANVGVIIHLIPNRLSSFLPSDTSSIVSIFGMAIMLATILPTTISLYMWRRYSTININILIVLAFVTLINAISHITSSAIGGIISPGLITGIVICIPYSIGVSVFVYKYFDLNDFRLILLGLISVLVYIFTILISWGFGILLINSN